MIQVKTRTNLKSISQDRKIGFNILKKKGVKLGKCVALVGCRRVSPSQN